MKAVKVKLEKLKKPEKNVRIHTPKQLSEFIRSVKMFGQMRPIVIDENNVILAGNGLFDALKECGYETAECYQYTDLTENQKKKLMIADNKIFTLGIENIETLNAFFNDLSGDLDIPGYDSEILKQMVADAEEITGKLSEYGTLQADEIESIRQAGERKEAKMAEAVESKNAGSGSYASESGESISVRTTNEFNETENTAPGETADVRKFIICPKCGEQIWL